MNARFLFVSAIFIGTTWVIFWWFSNSSENATSVHLSNNKTVPASLPLSGGTLAKPSDIQVKSKQPNFALSTGTAEPSSPVDTQNLAISAVQTESIATNNPQADLATAIPDIIHLLKTGGFLAFARKYMLPDQFAKNEAALIMMSQTTPGMVAQSRVPQLKEMAQRLQNLLDATVALYENLEQQTPTYNQNQDKATYMAPPLHPEDEPKPLVFVKIGGLWYLQDWEWANK